jgi:FkbM family methyltransferase
VSGADRSAKLLALLKQGVMLHNSGDLDEADRLYRRVLQQDPHQADALHLRALICLARGQDAEAAHLADAAIARASRVANFHNTAGEAYRRLGRQDLARSRLAEALRLEPGLVLALHNLSLVATAEGDMEEARRLNRAALERGPEHVDALLHAAELAVSETDEARVAAIADALLRRIEQPQVRRALARMKARRALQRLADLPPEELARLATEILGIDPAYCGGWLLEGELALRRADFATAEHSFAIAANLAPRDSDARLNLAVVLERERRVEEAESHLKSFLAGNPGHPMARFSLASLALLRGDHVAGWPGYEARRDFPGYRDPVPALPAWRGAAVERLLLYPEQGLGDTLQMLRFVPEACARAGGKVTLQVQAPLLRLARRMFGDFVADVLAADPGDAFDAACSLMSLPLALGIASRADLKADAAYLVAEPGLVADFSSRLAGLPGRKLGLVWRGAAGSDINRLRTTDDEVLAPLLTLSGWTPVSLQHGIANPRIGNTPLHDLADRIADFEDLAAAMTAVDAVVSLDSGPAHLAGALGLPARILLPRIHDWRWGRESERCDWYGSLCLYRQSAGGNWTAAVADLASDLGGMPRPARTPEVLPSRVVQRNQFPLVEVACRHGIFVLPLFDRYITLSLLAYGEYSPREAEVLASYLRPGDIVLDVGANLGALTLPMARAVGPGGRVIAFEPQSGIRSCLEASLRRSGIDWVEVRPQAAGSKQEKARIPRRDLSAAANSGGVSPGASAAGDEEVELVRLDDLGVSTCRLIRIDVEGMEVQVLAGAERLVATCRPVIYVECDRPGAQAVLQPWLTARGYRVFSHQPALFTPDNYRGAVADLFPGLVSGNLLALPTGEVPPRDAVPVD